MGRFAAQASGLAGRDLTRYEDLHHWSVTETAAFWGALADYVGIHFQTPPEQVYTPPPPGRILGARWFTGARLNYAENMLAGPERAEALVALAEGAPRRVYSLAELRLAVARVAAALQRAGVEKGDRVAGVIANLPEAIIAMLATASLGGVWSSCSPDFGASAVLDRLGQVTPKVVFFTSGYVYGGRPFDCLATAREVVARLPSVERAVLVTHLPEQQSAARAAAAAGAKTVTWDDFLAEGEESPTLRFAPLAFADPLYIMFSSGTTGVPKCITHGVGGTLLQHKKELLLHANVGEDARLLFYTTCGWMMWNWMASGLATGASLVLFEGSVASPDLGGLWRTVRDERVTAFGTSPKFIATCMSQGVRPSELLGGYVPETVLSTGAPLLPEHFAWIYEQVGADLHLASISGGTDIVSCFMLGTPLLPVRAGEIQYAGLGMAIDAWDEEAHPVRGGKGELVCTKPFVSMPVGFWNDETGERYRRAYFDYYQHLGIQVWRHGDFIEITPHGGIVVYGRSDATLNPGGVRIGTAELYRQVETLPEVLDSVAVGRHGPGGDTEVWLFVKLAAGRSLDQELSERIRKTIRTGLTPRHVPKAVIQVRDIPYTRSGKKVEVAVTQAIHGEPVPNLAAIANPEAMEEFFAMGASR